MNALTALLDRTEHERTDPLLVVGEAGMGKTPLLDEFARVARRRGAHVARAAAPEGGDVSAFAVIEDLAHRMSEHLDVLDEAEAELLSRSHPDGMIGPVARLGQDRVAVVAAARPRPALDPLLAAWQRLEVGPLALDSATVLLRLSLADRASRTLADDQPGP
jgi:hypothetical protein